MRIKFTKPDPRAGTIVEMDEARAKTFIDAGTAEKVGGDKAESAAPQNKAQDRAPSNKAITTQSTPARKPATVKKGR